MHAADTFFTHTEIFIYSLLLLLLFDCVCYWSYIVKFKPYAINAHKQTHCQYAQLAQCSSNLPLYAVQVYEHKNRFLLSFCAATVENIFSFFSILYHLRIAFIRLSYCGLYDLIWFDCCLMPQPTILTSRILCLHVFHGNLKHKTKDLADIFSMLYW